MPVNHATDADRMTVDQLAARAGVSVRTVRFYAGKGLLPPPHLQGRLGLYDEGHLARLELVRDLQAKGFTLAAIENYLDRIPDDAEADDIAVFRALLSPWVADAPERLSRGELEQRAGRPIDDDELERLAKMQLIEILDDGQVEVRSSELELGLELLSLPAPLEMFVEATELLDRHTGALAEELAALLRRHLVRPYLEHEVSPDELARLSRVIEQMKPLTVRAVVAAFERAVDRAARGRVAGR